MRAFAAVAVATCLIDSVHAAGWLSPRAFQPKSAKRATPASNGFITQQGTQLLLNGKPFKYVAANAYWLPQLNDADINATVASIAARNISVVRTWAFNDVTSIPDNGTWFQLLDPNGTAVINTGVNGIQRLDRIVDAVEANNMFVHFALTNNWNPAPGDTAVPANGTTFPRGTLSNDYGGMDAYVRFFKAETHDTFFSNQTIIAAFQNYIDVIINRYKNRTGVLTWELANDPRCNSTTPTSSTCNTATVTRWHGQVAQHVKALDPNHIISSGTGGFLCSLDDPAKCPKLFTKPAPPPPQASPAPGRKRAVPLTEKSILAERRARFKRTANTLAARRETASEKLKRGAKAIWKYRGRDDIKIISTRQATQNVGASMDGSQGVDSQDILNIPQIGFSTFQLFPDQNTYEPSDPNLDVINNTINAGTTWIQTQAQAAAASNKPAILTGVGIVTQTNAPSFVPFNSSQPLFPNTASITQIEQQPVPGGVGIAQGAAPVTDIQQQTVLQAWLQSAIDNDISGISVYQWGQANITAPIQQGQAPAPPTSNTFSPSIGQQNISPNDGYQILSPDTQLVVQQAAIQQEVDNIDIGGPVSS